MRTVMIFGCLLTICNLTLIAQTERFPRHLHVAEKSALRVPPQDGPTSLKVIYGNLGKVNTDLYDDTGGWAVEGPSSASGYSESVALPFKPKSNSHVSRVRVAVQHIAGANQINISIYADAQGLPGTLLAGPVTVTNLPEFATCCLLADADFAPLAVVSGTQYWVVADTPLTGTGSDFEGLWDGVVAPLIPMAANGNALGWTSFNANSLVAGAVLGSIP